MTAKTAVKTGSGGPKAARQTFSEAFAAEISAIYDSIMAEVGPKDLDYMEKKVKLSWKLSGIGRVRIKKAVTLKEWFSGIKLLAGHYCMEFANGHMIMHGCYDNIPGSKIKAADHKWNNAMSESDWRTEHNVYHHAETNIIGKDNDYGFLVARFNDRQPWTPYHLFQVPVVFAGLPLTLTAFVAWYMSAARALNEGESPWQPQVYQESARKALAMMQENYLAEPLKTGPKFLQTLAGNYLAKLTADTVFVLMLAVEHLNDDLASYTETPDSDQGEFYLRQILSTLNYYVDERFEDTFLGGINIHTEHHLFPDMPPNRLRQASVLVEKVCKKYGVPYQKRHWFEAIGELFATAVKYSSPFAKQAKEPGEELWKRMRELQPAKDPAKTGNAHTLTLKKTGKACIGNSRQTILDTLEAEGLTPKYGCRKGVCKECEVKKISGKTNLENVVAREHIRICIAKPKSDIELDL